MSDNSPTCDYPKVPQERTILILGETGVGKSSLINKISLILQFSTLDEALAATVADFKPPIATRGWYKSMDISQGRDFNERKEAETPRTINPRMYTISCKSCVFKLVDTPGFEDFGGDEMDERYVDYIRYCFGHFDEVHSVLAVLTACDNALSNCLKRILDILITCMGISAVKHINFIVTHVGKNMNVKNAFDAINAYFSSLKDKSGIELNIFGFEAQPFHYLMGLRKGAFLRTITHDDDNNTIFRNNRAELLRLLKNVCSASTPYNANDFRTLILAKQLQSQVCKLMKTSQRKIEEFLETIRKIEFELKDQQLKLSALKRKRMKHKLWTEGERIYNALGKVVRWTFGGAVVGAVCVLIPEDAFTVVPTSVYLYAAEVLAEISKDEVGLATGVVGALTGVFSGTVHYFWPVTDEIDPILKKNVECIRKKNRTVEKNLDDEKKAYHEFLDQYNELHRIHQEIKTYIEKYTIHMANNRRKENANSLNMPGSSVVDDCEILSYDTLLKRLQDMTGHKYFGEEIQQIWSNYKNFKSINFEEISIDLKSKNGITMIL